MISKCRHLERLKKALKNNWRRIGVELTRVAAEGSIGSGGNSAKGPTRIGDCHSCRRIPRKAWPNQQPVKQIAECLVGPAALKGTSQKASDLCILKWRMPAVLKCEADLYLNA